MDKTFFKDKTIRDVVDEETIIPQKFNEGYNIKDEEIRDIYVLKDDNNNLVFSDWLSGTIVIYKDGKPKILFSVYDLEHISFNKERGLIVAIGHEVYHEYWLDNGEYNEKHTR